MRFMQEKLRVAIPITEYNLLKKEVELAKQQTRQTQVDNFRLAEKYSEIQKKHRQDSDAVQKLEDQNLAYNALIEEYNIVKQRLEAFDPVFRFENQVFTSIARTLQHARVSPKQAFDEFDKDGSGTFTNSEFK